MPERPATDVRPTVDAEVCDECGEVITSAPGFPAGHDESCSLHDPLEPEYGTQTTCRAEEPPSDSVGLANLPALTERELRVLLSAVESRLRPTGAQVDDFSETGHVLWSLHTAISEAISAAQLDARRRSMADG